MVDSCKVSPQNFLPLFQVMVRARSIWCILLVLNLLAYFVLGSSSTTFPCTLLNWTWGDIMHGKSHSEQLNIDTILYVAGNSLLKGSFCTLSTITHNSNWTFFCTYVISYGYIAQKVGCFSYLPYIWISHFLLHNHICHYDSLNIAVNSRN